MSPPTDGWVYMGNEPMTEEDRQNLYDWLETTGMKDSYGSPQDIQIDKLSQVGLLHRDWSSHWAEYQKATNDGYVPQGGLGSTVYEDQHVGAGVDFAKESIWYTDSDTGESVKDIPPNCGAHHDRNMGGGYWDAYSGPEPGSEAEKLLGESHYEWDPKNGWYVIAGAAVDRAGRPL